MAELQGGLEREFDHVADQKGVAFSVQLAPDLPPAIATDPQRLRQMLKNLLSNAFKFTERGEVSVRVALAQSGWSPTNDTLARAGSVMAFTVTDTGIGITAELQARMFEAFAQADGTTARQYGGTGLGLSISRELVGLLGGEIALSSAPARAAPSPSTSRPSHRSRSARRPHRLRSRWPRRRPTVTQWRPTSRCRLPPRRGRA